MPQLAVDRKVRVGALAYGLLCWTWIAPFYGVVADSNFTLLSLWWVAVKDRDGLTAEEKMIPWVLGGAGCRCPSW